MDEADEYGSVCSRQSTWRRIEPNKVEIFAPNVLYQIYYTVLIR